MKRGSGISEFFMMVILLCVGIGLAGFGTFAATPASGADTFRAKCAACHAPDGSGNTPMGQKMKIRDLRSPEVQKQSDDELGNIIRNGKPPMPGYGKSLSATDIQQLVSYLRSIANKS